MMLLARCTLVHAVLTVGATAVGYWLGSRTPAVVEAERFVVRSADGAYGGEVGLSEAGASRLLLSKGGIDYVEVVTGPRPTISMRDDYGALRMTLALVHAPGSKHDEPTVALFDGEDRVRVRMCVLGDGRPTVDLFDGAGKHRIAMRVETKGAAHMEVFDKAGTGGLSLLSEDGGLSQLVVFDSARKERVWIGSRQDTPGVTVDDGAGDREPASDAAEDPVRVVKPAAAPSGK